MARRTSIVLGLLAHALELFFEFLQFLVGQIFEIDKLVASAFQRADQLVQFEMHCFGVAVLCVLNQEHHQKRNDSRGGVDDQLPGVREMKGRSSQDPDEDDKHGASKCPGASEQYGRTLRETSECVPDDAKKIALLLVSLRFFCPGMIRHVT